MIVGLRELTFLISQYLDDCFVDSPYIFFCDRVLQNCLLHVFGAMIIYHDNPTKDIDFWIARSMDNRAATRVSDVSLTIVRQQGL